MSEIIVGLITLLVTGVGSTTSMILEGVQRNDGNVVLAVPHPNASP